VLTTTLRMIPASESRPVRRADNRGDQPSTSLKPHSKVGTTKPSTYPPRNSTRAWLGSYTPASRSSIRTYSGDLSAGQPGQGERREPATDVRLDGDEMTADADDGDAGHATERTWWASLAPRPTVSPDARARG
jgi:hypothetical protein